MIQAIVNGLEEFEAATGWDLSGLIWAIINFPSLFGL
jgi:hypothetical protein